MARRPRSSARCGCSTLRKKGIKGMTPNGPSMTPQDTIEQALAAAKAGGECVVIADESSTANLRWAGNTLTTNGVAATRSLTVIAIDRRTDGTAGVGTVTRSGVTPDQVEDLGREAEKAAGDASTAEDTTELLSGETSTRSAAGAFDLPPQATDFAVFRGFSAQLGAAPRRPGASSTGSPSTA